eukprot:1125056-Amphidinium_carterae.1
MMKAILAMESREHVKRLEQITTSLVDRAMLHGALSGDHNKTQTEDEVKQLFESLVKGIEGDKLLWGFCNYDFKWTFKVKLGTVKSRTFKCTE